MQQLSGNLNNAPFSVDKILRRKKPYPNQISIQYSEASYVMEEKCHTHTSHNWIALRKNFIRYLWAENKKE